MAKPKKTTKRGKSRRWSLDYDFIFGKPKRRKKKK